MQNSQLRIATDRLYLRRLRNADAADLFQTVGDPDVMRFWHPGPDANLQETTQRIREIENHWQLHGFGDWGVVKKKDDRLIGFSGLHYISNMAEVNMGYAFEKSMWRQGLGFETCRAVLDFGFRKLELDQIVSVIALENEASRCLAEKCGLYFWKTLTWSGQERVVYEISQDRYLRS